jgi:hypothetical protein
LYAIPRLQFLPVFPTLEVTNPHIFKVLIDHLPRDATLEDLVQLCDDFGELCEIENSLNPTRPTGGNLEFAVLSFTTHNAARKAIRQLNNLTLVTQLERKTLWARYSIKHIIWTFDRPLPTDVRHGLIKKEIICLSSTDFRSLNPLIYQI